MVAAVTTSGNRVRNEAEKAVQQHPVFDPQRLRLTGAAFVIRYWDMSTKRIRFRPVRRSTASQPQPAQRSQSWIQSKRQNYYDTDGICKAVLLYVTWVQTAWPKNVRSFRRLGRVRNDLG